jgi:membrane-bound metal-dependent hydrolase YbcI (DUF457 family)
MFVGHYAPALAAKAVAPRVPLWVLAFAVQFMDVVWAILVLLGIEKLRIEPGFLAASDLDLFYMPYTHSLPGSLILSAILGGVYFLFRKADGAGAAFVVALAVFSHWIADLIVHAPDLPLWGNEFKVGFGLWAYREIALALEIGLLFAGTAWWMSVSKPKGTLGPIAIWLMFAVLTALQLAQVFVIKPDSPPAMASSALATYFGFTLLAWLLERTRTPKQTA